MNKYMIKRGHWIFIPTHKWSQLFVVVFFSVRTNMFCIIGKKADIKAVMEIAIAFPLFSVIKLF